jgi:hypothetical protein
MTEVPDLLDTSARTTTTTVPATSFTLASSSSTQLLRSTGSRGSEDFTSLSIDQRFNHPSLGPQD